MYIQIKDMNFEKSQEPRTNTELLDRLRRLDLDLMTAKTKRFDYLDHHYIGTTGRNPQSYQIYITRKVDGGYFASVKAVGRVFRITASSPSAAYVAVVRSLTYGVDRWFFEDQYQRQVLSQLSRRMEERI